MRNRTQDAKLAFELGLPVALSALISVTSYSIDPTHPLALLLHILQYWVLSSCSIGPTHPIALALPILQHWAWTSYSIGPTHPMELPLCTLQNWPYPSYSIGPTYPISLAIYIPQHWALLILQHRPYPPYSIGHTYPIALALHIRGYQLIPTNPDCSGAFLCLFNRAHLRCMSIYLFLEEKRAIQPDEQSQPDHLRLCAFQRFPPDQ